MLPTKLPEATGLSPVQVNLEDYGIEGCRHQVKQRISIKE
jgi:hypothetical protein